MQLRKLPEQLRVTQLTVRDAEENMFTSPVDDLDGYGQPDELVFLAAVPAGGRRAFLWRGGCRSRGKENLRVTDDLRLAGELLECRVCAHISVEARRHSDDLQALILDRKRAGVDFRNAMTADLYGRRFPVAP